MEKEVVRIETPFTVAGVTLVPIVKTRLDCWRSQSRLSFFSIKQPVGIVVISPQVERGFRISGEEVSLDQLKKEVPDIKEVLEGL